MSKPTLDLSEPWYERGGPRDYVTTRPIVWVVGGKYATHAVTIPAGFAFESSVPRLARWIVSPHDPRFLLAACVHDFLLEVERYEVLAAAAEWHSAAKKGKAPARLRVPMFVGVSLYTLTTAHYTQA